MFGKLAYDKLNC